MHLNPSFMKYAYLSLFGLCCLALACNKSDQTGNGSYPAIQAAFGTEINPNNWTNYAGQTVPAYIQKNNSPNNPINNAKATLGRVLFYDKNLSVTNTISCGSCHQQAFAFSDTALASNGILGGLTDRHTMRLINSRFAIEPTFFGMRELPRWRHKQRSRLLRTMKWASAVKQVGATWQPC